MEKEQIENISKTFAILKEIEGDCVDLQNIILKNSEFFEEWLIEKLLEDLSHDLHVISSFIEHGDKNTSVIKKFRKHKVNWWNNIKYHIEHLDDTKKRNIINIVDDLKNKIK